MRVSEEIVYDVEFAQEWKEASELTTTILSRAIFEGIEMAGDYPVGGDLAYYRVIENPCLYCGQEYREVKFRWNDERRVGCSKCGAQK